MSYQLKGLLQSLVVSHLKYLQLGVCLVRHGQTFMQHVHLSWGEINYAHASTFDAETARDDKQNGTADLLRV